MIYQVHYYDEVEGSHGFEYFSSRRPAQKSMNKWAKDTRLPDASITAFETPKTKRDMIQLLNACGSHPDNG